MLEELRSLSEANKKRVLIIATIIIMIIVIGVWVAYFNSIVIGNSQAPAGQASSTTTTAPVAIAIVPASTTPAQASGPSIWQDIKNGFASFMNIFRNPSQYNIQPKSN